MEVPQILVVEDDRAIRNLITTTLETQHYQFITAENGQMAILGVLSHQPDVVVLDLGLPDMDGKEFIEKVRGWSSVPILVVSARGDDREKIAALDCGADDYLTKPFSTEELLARLRVTLRRLRYMKFGQLQVSNEFVNGGLRIDYAAGSVSLDGSDIHLTPIEYRLLCLLAQNVGKVLTHNYILKEIWEHSLPSDTPSLRVFMATLRKKIEPNTAQPRYIQTHIGIGYRMLRIEEQEEPAEPRGVAL